MDIKELDKKQLVLLTLLITFVVSIATGIITVSLMNQMPKSVPQTVNNVIQRTIEKVTTVETPSVDTGALDNGVEKVVSNPSSFFSNNDTLINIYLNNSGSNTTDNSNPEEPQVLGQGIIISDLGLVLIDSDLVNDSDSYKVILDKTDFSASILKKFNNGFTILKISTIEDKPIENIETPTPVQ
jgi:hypothetical protein